MDAALFERVDELTKELKSAKADLKAAIEETEHYKKVLVVTMKQAPLGCMTIDLSI